MLQGLTNIKRALAILLVYLLFDVSPVVAFESDRPEVREFIESMVNQNGFKRDDLISVLSQAQSQPKIIKAMSAPAKSRPLAWYEYEPRFVNARRINGGIDFWQRNEAALSRASQQFGVPPEIIVAIIGVETSYGTNTGSFRVLDALATLAFDYPRRAEFYRGELQQFLIFTRDGKIDPFSLTGSYAGAMGLPQFMPSSYRRFAIDFDGDGKADLWSNETDVIGSVANFLAAHGWQRDQPLLTRASLGASRPAALDEPGLPRKTVAEWAVLGVVPQSEIASERQVTLLALEQSSGMIEYWLGLENFYVITRYNRSIFYAMSVIKLGEKIRMLRKLP